MKRCEMSVHGRNARKPRAANNSKWQRATRFRLIHRAWGCTHHPTAFCFAAWVRSRSVASGWGSDRNAERATSWRGNGEAAGGGESLSDINCVSRRTRVRRIQELGAICSSDSSQTPRRLKLLRFCYLVSSKIHYLMSSAVNKQEHIQALLATIHILWQSVPRRNQ